MNDAQQVRIASAVEKIADDFHFICEGIIDYLRVKRIESLAQTRYSSPGAYHPKQIVAEEELISREQGDHT